MKKIILLVCLPFFGMSQQALFHYWHFNNLSGTVDSVAADFSLVSGQHYIYYPGTGAGYMDSYNTGSALNLFNNHPAGNALRVRNPSDTREMIFDIPTTGFDDIVITFDLQRSNSGQEKNVVEFSTDGVNFGFLANVDTITPTTSYQTYTLNLTSVAAADNNPNFKMRITYVGSNSGTNGNNRYDNIAVQGVPQSLQPVTGISVSPSVMTMVVGQTGQFLADVQPTNATNQLVHWSSADSNIASVDAHGNVTAHGVGNVFISATSDDGGFSDSAEVIVAISPNTQRLIHYWHFNTLADGHVVDPEADYSLIPNVTPIIHHGGTGNGYIDRFSPGSSNNLQLGESAGFAIRVRNPSVGRWLEIDLPTNQCSEVALVYDCHRSGSGMLSNLLEYTVDGLNYTNAGLAVDSVSIEAIEPGYLTYIFSFASIPGVDNNPNFKVRIWWSGNINQGNGNNRYDNVALFGNSQLSLSRENAIEARVYPNPAKDFVQVSGELSGKTDYTLFAINGAVVSQGTTDAADGNAKIDIDGTAPGIYILMIENNGKTGQYKIAVE